MIDLRLATRLKRAGLAWHPEPGDRFAVPQPELLGQVFTLSDMTIEVHDRPTGPLLGFNGTTEWALDSVQAADVVWLPAEHQLRALLGPAFRGLQVCDGVEAAGSDEGPVETDSAEAAGSDEDPAETDSAEAAGSDEGPTRADGDDETGPGAAPVGSGDTGAFEPEDIRVGPGGDGTLGSGCFRVLATIPGWGERGFQAPAAEDAYALALLALIRRATD